ncbi:MAG TPA: hypothetical protein VGM90_07070 [Kofleriaceae bacterium]|jgi:hypothetical protein
MDAALGSFGSGFEGFEMALQPLVEDLEVEIEISSSHTLVWPTVDREIETLPKVIVDEGLALDAWCHEDPSQQALETVSLGPDPLFTGGFAGADEWRVVRRLLGAGAAFASVVALITVLV